jgi:hypothetical protein
MEKEILNYKKFYAKQLKDRILSICAYDLTLTRLTLICNIISKSKSQLIIEVHWELYLTMHPER